MKWNQLLLQEYVPLHYSFLTKPQYHIAVTMRRNPKAQLNINFFSFHLQPRLCDFACTCEKTFISIVVVDVVFIVRRDGYYVVPIPLCPPSSLCIEVHEPVIPLCHHHNLDRRVTSLVWVFILGFLFFKALLILSVSLSLSDTHIHTLSYARTYHSLTLIFLEMAEWSLLCFIVCVCGIPSYLTFHSLQCATSTASSKLQVDKERSGNKMMSRTVIKFHENEKLVFSFFSYTRCRGKFKTLLRVWVGVGVVKVEI